MKRNRNWQFSQSSWMPKVLKNFMPEFLDFIVSLVEANKPFLDILQLSPDKKIEFYLYAPEVGGSSVHLVSHLRKQFPESTIHVISNELSSARKEHLQRVQPLLNEASFIHLKEIPKKTTHMQRIVISINQAHLLCDQKLIAQLNLMTNLFDQILIGEGNNKSVRQVIGMLLLSPLVALALSPRVKPFRWSRLFFTYVIPIFPIMISWDGIVALFKIRSPEQIRCLAETRCNPGWAWQSGKSPNNRGGFVIYLYGQKIS